MKANPQALWQLAMDFSYWHQLVGFPSLEKRGYL
jgi:hypothetical protein